MKNELLELEIEKFGLNIPLLDYIYVIQTKRKHDSGYKCMEIIGVNNKGYKKRLASNCDVIDLDNIFTSKEWCLSIDIPAYNVMRIFSHKGRFKVNWYGISTFSFEIVERSDEE